MTLKFNHLIIFLVGVIFGLLWCISGIRSPKKQDGRLLVVCTTSIIADTVSNIAHDHVQIVSLMGPGIDPHLYKAVENDVISLAQADIIFFNGLHLEARMADVLEHIPNTITCAISKNISQDLLIGATHAQTTYDPHIWFDIHIWKQVAQTITDTLCCIDKQHAFIYQANCKNYIEQLESVHLQIVTLFADLSKEQRVLITGHDAFSYFARNYNFTIMSLQGISTESSPGAADMYEMIQTIIAKKIPAIFLENSLPRKNMLALQEGIQESGHTVTFGGELFADSLSEPSGPASTYITMLLYNAKTIAQGLTLLT